MHKKKGPAMAIHRGKNRHTGSERKGTFGLMVLGLDERTLQDVSSCLASEGRGGVVDSGFGGWRSPCLLSQG